MQPWLKADPTLEVVQARGSPVKQGGHQTVSVTVKERYKVPRRQKGGKFLFPFEGSGKTLQKG